MSISCHFFLTDLLKDQNFKFSPIGEINIKRGGTHCETITENNFKSSNYIQKFINN